MYGIESASKFYFGKNPSLLTLGECALLAGIIPAPEIRSPFRNPGRYFSFVFFLTCLLFYDVLINIAMA